MTNRGSSDDLIREAKTWLAPGDRFAVTETPVRPVEIEPVPGRVMPSDRIAADEPGMTWAEPSPAGGSARSVGTGIGVAVLVAVVGLVGAVFFAQRSTSAHDTTSIFEVSPGMCFLDPGGSLVDSVRLVDCTEPHDLEAFAVVPLPFASDAARPGDDELFSAAYAQCLPYFAPYTGDSYDTSIWYLDAMVPDRRGWKAGDREALCVLFQTDATGSVIQSTVSAQG